MKYPTATASVYSKLDDLVLDLTIPPYWVPKDQFPQVLADLKLLARDISRTTTASIECLSEGFWVIHFTETNPSITMQAFIGEAREIVEFLSDGEGLPIGDFNVIDGMR